MKRNTRNKKHYAYKYIEEFVEDNFETLKNNNVVNKLLKEYKFEENRSSCPYSLLDEMDEKSNQLTVQFKFLIYSLKNNVDFVIELERLENDYYKKVLLLQRFYRKRIIKKEFIKKELIKKELNKIELNKIELNKIEKEKENINIEKENINIEKEKENINIEKEKENINIENINIEKKKIKKYYFQEDPDYDEKTEIIYKHLDSHSEVYYKYDDFIDYDDMIGIQYFSVDHQQDIIINDTGPDSVRHYETIHILKGDTWVLENKIKYVP